MSKVSTPQSLILQWDFDSVRSSFRSKGKTNVFSGINWVEGVEPLTPFFHKLFIFSFQLSDAAHARLRKAQSRRRINKDTKSALAKWLKQLQFKMALAEQQPDGSLFI